MAKAEFFCVCANQSLGQPDGGASPYVLMDLVRKSWPDHELRYTALPWARCLQEAADGLHDAVLSASYTAQRAQGLRYPGPEAAPDDAKRMFRIGYVLLKRKSSRVQWDGKAFTGTSSKPGESLGAERGYSIVQFARDRGAQVEDRYPQITSLLDSLKLGRIAGILINQEHAAQLLTEPSWSQDFEVSGQSLQTKAYHLPFSRAYVEREPQRTQQIWNAIEKARQTPAFQRHFSLSMTASKRRDLQP